MTWLGRRIDPNRLTAWQQLDVAAALAAGLAAHARVPAATSTTAIATTSGDDGTLGAVASSDRLTGVVQSRSGGHSVLLLPSHLRHSLEHQPGESGAIGYIPELAASLADVVATLLLGAASSGGDVDVVQACEQQLAARVPTSTSTPLLQLKHRRAGSGAHLSAGQTLQLLQLLASVSVFIVVLPPNIVQYMQAVLPIIPAHNWRLHMF
jgi:hypothetical protein